jgi:hypothetical protein
LSHCEAERLGGSVTAGPAPLVITVDRPRKLCPFDRSDLV